MKTNKLDNNIKKKFENRTFEPSASAWERLSVKLDEQPKQKKIGWFFYIGAAASVLLLVSIGFQLFNNGSQQIIPEDEIVISPINTNIIDEKIEEFINEIPVEEALVKEEVEIKTNPEIKTKANKDKFKAKKINSIPNIKEKNLIANVEENLKIIKSVEKNENNNELIKVKLLKQDPNSSIKINANDLLYAVTHSPIDVKKYYAKYNVNREDILKTIKSELRKSNIKVNPSTILAEVERNIDDDDFQNNFMKSLKRRVSDIASVIASRNQ